MGQYSGGGYNGGGGSGCSGTPSIGCGNGFSLGDAANYGIIAFDPHNFQGTADSPIYGNVGIGSYSGIQLANDTITGNLITVGAAPSSIGGGGTVTGQICGGNTQLACDIAGLQSLSSAFACEAGTKVNPNGVIQASCGTLDAGGNEVFTLTSWSKNMTICGTACQHVVLNVSNTSINLDNLTLCGGLTANDVLINYTGNQEIHGTNGGNFTGTVLAPNAKVNVDGVNLNGHIYGGAPGQDFQWVSNAVLHQPPCSC